MGLRMLNSTDIPHIVHINDELAYEYCMLDSGIQGRCHGCDKLKFNRKVFRDVNYKGFNKDSIYIRYIFVCPEEERTEACVRLFIISIS